MNRFNKPSGPRCVVCGRTFQPRVLRDGSLSQTCGQIACVSTHSRRKTANPAPVRPKSPKNASLV